MYIYILKSHVKGRDLIPLSNVLPSTHIILETFILGNVQTLAAHLFFRQAAVL